MGSRRRKVKYDEIQEAGYGFGRGSMKVERLSQDELKLVEAVKLKQMKKFKTLLDTGVNPNIRDDMGSTPLHYAADDTIGSEGQSEILVTLLHCGADPNASDRWGKTALHYAVQGCTANVRSLLNVGAHIDAQDNGGTTPLMTVARHGAQGEAVEVVQLLADSGCNVHLRCTEGCTAMHALCQNSKLCLADRCRIARMLLGLGLSATAEDKSGQQAICHELQRVDSFGHQWRREELALILLLVQAGSTLNLQKKQHQELVLRCLNFMESSFNWEMLQMLAPALPLSTLQRFSGFFHRASNKLGYTKDMERYAAERARTPRSLRGCCRHALRELFRGKVFYRTQTLSVPETVRNYICNLEDDFVFVPSEEKKG